MESSVSLANWQFYGLVILAIYGLWQLVFMPQLQRYFYHRSQTTENRLDEELQFGLSSYAMANRPLWIDRVLSDPEVKNAIDVESKATTLSKANANAQNYADEIVPAFKVLLYFRIGYWIARRLLRFFYWIQVGSSTEEKYRNIKKDSCVIMVSNHRSNFDPLLLIYLTSKTAPVSYSAGEWALISPFKQLFHALGFFIVRRDSGDNPLYRKILERYVYLATSHCVPQGVFLEGGLTRDGRMLPPKLGLLNYQIKALGKQECKDIVFIPCALNYDKIPEEKTLIANRENGFEEKGRIYTIFAFLKFLLSLIAYIAPRRHKPFGYACVNFGNPISLNDWQSTRNINLNELAEKDRREYINKLGAELAFKINELLPILPTCLLAKVIADCDSLPITELELKYRATQLIEKLTVQKAPIFLPKNDGDYALSQGIYILIRRKIIKPLGDGRFELVEQNRKSLEFYCNTIADFVK